MPQTRRRPAYAGAILVVTLLVLTSDMHTLAVTLRTVSRTGSFSPPRPSRVSDARPVAPVHRPPLPQPARPPTPEAAADRVAHAVQTLAPGTDVSLAVVDRQTQAMDTSHDADRVYRAGQLTKLLIAVDLLTDTEPGGPSADERENCYQMLAASDDAVATNLWDEGDQTEIVTRTAARLGLRATQPPRDPTDWGGTLITARDVVAVYRYITDQLPEPGRALILGRTGPHPPTHHRRHRRILRHPARSTRPATLAHTGIHGHPGRDPRAHHGADRRRFTLRGRAADVRATHDHAGTGHPREHHGRHRPRPHSPHHDALEPQQFKTSTRSSNIPKRKETIGIHS